MAEFTPDQISGPTQIPGRANFAFAVALPDGSEGHAVVGVGDLNETAQAAPVERVAAALNFEVQGHDYEAIVAELKSPDGFWISLTGF